MTDNPAAVRCSIGVDVSKDALDIFIDSPAEEYRVANQTGDVTALVERLKSVAPDYIVVKASGGFESALMMALARPQDCRSVASRPSGCAHSRGP